MTTPNSLRNRLKTQTMQAHDKIEQNSNLSRLMSPSLTAEHYLSVIKRYLGFFRPLEAKLCKNQELVNRISNFEERLRTPALVADLKSLGLTQSEIDELPDCHELPSLEPSSSSHAENSSTKLNLLTARALGIAYVLEGSTLGGSMMAKKLSCHSFLSSDSLHFLSGHGEKTGKFWQDFVKVLETADADSEGALNSSEHEAWREAATSAASETFTKMDNWMA